MCKINNTVCLILTLFFVVDVFMFKSCAHPFEGEEELADIKTLGQMYVCEEAQCRTQLDMATKFAHKASEINVQFTKAVAHYTNCA